MLKHVNADIDCCYQCPYALRSCQNGRVRIVCHVRSLDHPRKVIPRIEDFPDWCPLPDVMPDGHSEMFCLDESEVAKAEEFKKEHTDAGCGDGFGYLFYPTVNKNKLKIKIYVTCLDCKSPELHSVCRLDDH